MNRAAGRAARLLLAASCAACAATSDDGGAAPPPDSPALDPAAQWEVATTLFRAERWEKASAHAEALLAGKPSFEPQEALRFVAAESAFRLGDFDHAARAFRELCTRFPYGRTRLLAADRLYACGVAQAREPRPLLGGIDFDYAPAIETLGFLVVHFRESERSAAAWLELAATHARAGQHALAAAAYERLLLQRPGADSAEEAAFRVAHEYRALSRGPGYDAEPLLRSRAALDRYLDRFGGGGRYREAALAMRAEISEKIALTEAEVARFYRERGAEAGTGESLRPRAERPPWATSGNPPPWWSLLTAEGPPEPGPH